MYEKTGPRLPKISKISTLVEPLNFVTVVYAAELPLVELQARSFAACFDPECIDKIHVIINDPEPLMVATRFISEILPRYGPCSGKVKIWQGDDLVGTPGSKNWSQCVKLGWFRQQILKLKIAQEINTNLYVALDAKNHFFRPATRSSFLSSSGKPLSWRMTTNGPLRGYFEDCLKTFGLNIKEMGEPMMPSVTPYVFWTRVVRDLIDDLESRTGMTFTRFFLEGRKNLSEFHLYYAFFRSKHMCPSQIYDFGPSPLVGLFRIYAKGEAEELREIKLVDKPDKFVLGIHSCRIGALRSNARHKLVETWLASGIFIDRSQALTYLDALPPASE